MKTLALRGFAFSALLSAGCAANAGSASFAASAPTTETTSASVPAMPDHAGQAGRADRSDEARAFIRRANVQGTQDRDLREVASWKARCAAADADACTMVDRDRLR